MTITNNCVDCMAENTGGNPIRTETPVFPATLLTLDRERHAHAAADAQ